MNLQDFLDLAPKVRGTVRYARLAKWASYFAGTQYAGRPLDTGGYQKSMPTTPGSVSRSPRWSERDPGAVWNLRAETVEELTDWAVSGDAWCNLTVDDDPDAQDWLTTVVVMSGLVDTISQARDYGGGEGNAIVAMAIRSGEYFFEALEPCSTWAISWDDEVRHRPAEVGLVYEAEDPTATAKGEPQTVVRYWSKTTESVYRRVRDAQTQEWKWILDWSFNHNLGFCPVWWCPQTPPTGSHDGVPDGGEGLEALIDDANELFAAGSATTKRNADDTLVVREDPALNPGKVRKGGFNVIFARGGAEYLSQNGDSARVAIEIAEKRAAQFQKRVRVAMPSLEDLGRATSGEVIRRIYQPTMRHAGKIRRLYARQLIVPICQGILMAARILIGRGQSFALPPRVDRDPKTGVNTVTGRTPGTSGFVRCVWPDMAPPTPAEIGQQIDALTKATGMKQILSQRTAVTALAASPLPVQNVDSELDAIQADAAAAAASSAQALGLDDGGGPGKAGPIGAKGGSAAGDDSGGDDDA